MGSFTFPRLWLLVGMLLPAPVWADKSADDLVQKHLGIFVTVPARREASERVVDHGDRLEIWFLRSTRNKEAALCDGVRWLLTGRLAASEGAKALFEANPQIETLTLVFYTVQTEVNPDRNGRYVQKRAAQPQARFTVTRETAQRLAPSVLRKTLVGARCAAKGPDFLDKVWTR